MNDSDPPIMRIIGQRRVVELPDRVPVKGAFDLAAAHQASVFALENRVLIPRGCYRMTHEEANRQMDDATVALMVAVARSRVGE